MRSCSRAASRRRTPDLVPRWTRCALWDSTSGCIRAAHIRDGLRGSLPKLDWVGIDVKAPLADYATVTGVPGSGLTALASLDLVRDAGVAHEVRTTVHPGLTPPDAMERLARELGARGIERWILQAFRPTGCANEAIVAAAPEGATLDRALLARLSAHVPVIEVRG